MSKKSALLGIALVSLLGIADAGYLTYEHYAGGIPPCTISGCETVLTSAYATIYGFPISLLGILFYFSVFTTTLFLYKKEVYLVKTFLLAVTTGGFLFSLFLFYLQAQVLSAFCQYCLISFALSTTLFVLSFIVFIKKNNSSPVLN
jgi:uncharacterized membrane protein